MLENGTLVMEPLETSDGVFIRMGGTYWGKDDGIPWHVVAQNNEYVYGYRADLQKPEVTDYGQLLKRIKPEWLASREQDSLEAVVRELCNLYTTTQYAGCDTLRVADLRSLAVRGCDLLGMDNNGRR